MKGVVSPILTNEQLQKIVYRELALQFHKLASEADRFQDPVMRFAMSAIYAQFLQTIRDGIFDQAIKDNVAFAKAQFASGEKQTAFHNH